MKLFRFIFFSLFIAILFSCLKKKELATVNTVSVTEKTSSGCISGGNVTSDGGASVTSKGVCWATISNPTISNYKTDNGTGIGPFASNMSGLFSETTYYIRAYATNGVGTNYGNQVSFTTLVAVAVPTITTTDISAITQTTATGGGNVTSAGNGTITARGVCYSTSPNPTVDLISKTSDGTGTGTFTSNLTGLTASTKYYIRAFATNSAGTNYGNELFFTTSCAPPTAPVVGTITQPTCSVATGSVALSGLPSTGTWTLIRMPGGTSNTGTGTTTAVTGLPAGATYTFTVINSFGCVSTITGGVIIASLPLAPSATTDTESDDGSNSATLNGTVNANGSATTISFEYGTTIDYGYNLSASPGQVNGNNSLVISAVLTGLANNTTYHFRIKAVNCQGTTYGLDRAFATGCFSSNSVIDATSNITATTATLNGKVDTYGSATTVTFEYGTTSNYGNSVPVNPGILSGFSHNIVSANLTGLLPNTTYHFSLKMVWCNGGTISYEADQTFTTYAATDEDGNNYTSVSIGSQTWLVENLKTTRYNDGTSIPNVTNNTTWASMTSAAYCWYNYDEVTYKTIYGSLYNWFAISANNLCPIGWHVPTDQEWHNLVLTLDINAVLADPSESSIAGGKLKATGTVEAGNGLWLSPNSGATNESGFTALSGGRTYYDGSFVGEGSSAAWWSSTELYENGVWARGMSFDNSDVSRTYSTKQFGYYVRCLKD